MDKRDKPGLVEIMKQLEAVFSDGDTIRLTVSDKLKSYAQVESCVPRFVSDKTVAHRERW